MLTTQQIVEAIHDELSHARELHPEHETMPHQASLILNRAGRLNTQANALNDPDAQRCVPRTAVQVAGLAIRFIQDQDLQLPSKHDAT